MDDPATEIESVIQALVSSSPSDQRQTIETYFLPNASFTHPFCRTGIFDGSRILIRGIYRWYKIMSPRIDLTVHSVSYDKANETLYVSISQVFAIWFVPFYRAPVSLVTVLKLQRDDFDGKYYLKSQEDLYQTSEFVKFVLPGLGPAIVWLWQIVATLMCLLLAFVFWPVTWYEEKGGEAKQRVQSELRGAVSAVKNQSGVSNNTGHSNGEEKAGKPFGNLGGGSGLVTAPSVEKR